MFRLILNNLLNSSREQGHAHRNYVINSIRRFREQSSIYRGLTLLPVDDYDRLSRFAKRFVKKYLDDFAVRYYWNHSAMAKAEAENYFISKFSHAYRSLSEPVLLREYTTHIRKMALHLVNELAGTNFNFDYE
jgi:hypothetical protein